MTTETGIYPKRTDAYVKCVPNFLKAELFLGFGASIECRKCGSKNVGDESLPLPKSWPYVSAW